MAARYGSAAHATVDAPAASSQLAALRNRFVELFGRKLTRRDFAAEVARLVGEAIDCRSLAVLGYDRRRERLVHLADRDLPAEVRAVLIGGGSERAWDIPLRALRNRRISVIEAAHQNPFVPRALIELAPTGLTIAAVPVYYEYKPTAVVLLVAAAGQAFADSDLNILSQALRVSARGLRETYGAKAIAIGTEREEEIAEAAIAELTEQKPDAEAQGGLRRPEERETAAAPSRRAEADRQQLAEARQLADSLLSRTQRLEQDLARAHAELERSAQTARALTASRHGVARERDDLSAKLADMERRRENESADLRAEVAALEDRLLATESERIRHQRAAELVRAGAQKSTTALEAERDSLRERLRETDAGLAALQAEIAAVRDDRDRLAAQVEAFVRQLQANQSTFDEAQSRSTQELAAVAADRDGWKDKNTRLQAQLAQRTEEQRVLDHEMRSALAARDASLRQLAAARDELERLGALQENLGQTTSQAEAERAAALAQNESLRQAIEKERASTLRQQQELSTELGSKEAQLTQASAQVASLQAALAKRDRIVNERDQQLSALLRERDEATRAAEDASRGATELRAEMGDLRTQLEQSRAEGERLLEERKLDAEQMEKLLASRTSAERTLAKDLQESRNEIAKLQQGRESLRAALGEEEQRAAEAQAALADTQRRLQASFDELRQQLDTLSGEKTDLEHQLEEVNRAASAEGERAEAEARRVSALSQQCATLEANLGSSEKRHTELAGELAQAQSEIQALRSEAADRGVLARRTAELESKSIELDRLLEGAREEIDAVRADLSAAEQQKTALEEDLHHALQQQSQKSDVVGREAERLREAVQRSNQERDRLSTELSERASGLERQRAAHAAAVAELQATLERVKSERDQALAERDQQTSAANAALSTANEAATLAVQEGKTVAHRLVEKQRRVDELAETIRQRETAVESAQAERRRVEEALHAAEEAVTEIQRERDEFLRRVELAEEQLEQQKLEHADALEAARQSYEEQLATERQSAREREQQARQASQFALDQKRTARYDAPLIIERSAPLGTVVEQAESPVASQAEKSGPEESKEAPDSKEAESSPLSGPALLLDDGPHAGEAMAALKDLGLDLSMAAPAEAAVDEAARHKFSYLLLNLASGVPSWRTLKALRERVSTRALPILAYVVTPEAPTGFSFGLTDFAVWPMDPGRLIERLTQMRPRLRRLLVVSADIEGMGRLREPLARVRISTSMVLDGRQARDLGAGIQPEAAVMHLSPSCPDIARAVASFRSAEATRDLPLLILLDKADTAREEVFFAGANRELVRNGSFELSALGEEATRVFKRLQSP